MKVGLIGGTGFYDLLESCEKRVVETEYGDVHLVCGELEGK